MVLRKGIFIVARTGLPRGRGRAGILGMKGMDVSVEGQEIFADRVLIGDELVSACITVKGTRIQSVKRVGRGEWEGSRGE